MAGDDRFGKPCRSGREGRRRARTGGGPIAGAVEGTVAGESVLFRADRTLFWPRERTLFVADLHLGKGAAFRAGGLPVPAGSTTGTLAALDRAVVAARAERVVLLGDTWHARAGRTEENRDSWRRWRAGVGIEIVSIIGNHDVRAGADDDALPEGEAMGPFILRHHPDPDPRGYVLCGHLHPAYQVEGRGGTRLRLPCFWFGDRVGVLPAFGELTGTAPILPGTGDTVVVIAEETAIKMPIRDRSGNLRR